ncbi:MAG: hypothetical protein WC292_00235 [Clostridia bacterium]
MTTHKTEQEDMNTIFLAIVILFAIAGMFVVFNTVSNNNKLHEEIEQALAEQREKEPLVVKEYIHHIVEIEKEPVLTEVELPKPHRDFISMMDYQKVTNKTSKQYGYILLSEVEEFSGLMKFQGRYMVAMGSYYGDLGTKYDVLLTNGETIRVVVTERKDDKHTDEKNQYQKWDGSILEFVINKEVMSKQLGNHIVKGGNVFNIIGGYPKRIWRVE